MTDHTAQIRREIERIEANARKAKVPISEVQKEAGIHRRTWDRWKDGERLPQMRLWNSLMSVAKRIEKQAARA